MNLEDYDITISHVVFFLHAQAFFKNGTIASQTCVD